MGSMCTVDEAYRTGTFICERSTLSYIDKLISECCLVSSGCDSRCASRASLIASVVGAHIHHNPLSQSFDIGNIFLKSIQL